MSNNNENNASGSVGKSDFMWIIIIIMIVFYFTNGFSGATQQIKSTQTELFGNNTSVIQPTPYQAIDQVKTSEQINQCQPGWRPPLVCVPTK